MPSLWPQKMNTSLVEAYLELTGNEDNSYCHNSGFLVPCPCHKQPCPPKHENRALWAHFVFLDFTEWPNAEQLSNLPWRQIGTVLKNWVVRMAAPKELADKNLPALKTLLKALTLGDVNLRHPQALQSSSKEKIFQGKDLPHLCFDEKWMVEYHDLSISVVIGTQHMWTTRWSQFSSRKRRIWEARTSWKKNKYGTTFCHSEKKTTHSYGTLHLPKEELCQMHSS